MKEFEVNGEIKETDFENKIKNGIKIHTIRRDFNDRWKEGRKIHFSTGARTKNYNLFKEGLCSGVQGIRISGRMVYVDNLLLSYEGTRQLAINDGFDSVEDFWAWFGRTPNFEGKIIHWTDLRY